MPQLSKQNVRFPHPRRPPPPRPRQFYTYLSYEYEYACTTIYIRIPTYNPPTGIMHVVDNTFAGEYQTSELLATFANVARLSTYPQFNPLPILYGPLVPMHRRFRFFLPRKIGKTTQFSSQVPRINLA